MYRSSLYDIVYISYKLLKTGQLFGPPCICARWASGIQGVHWSWKVIEFSKTIFQAWK